MIELYLVRHGETDWNKKLLCQGRIDNHLNDNGKIQAHNLGKKIKDKGLSFDVFMTSPLIRAQETLSIIKDELNINLPTIINEGFIERDFGELETQDVALVRDVIDSNKESYYPGCERNSSLEERVYCAAIDLLKEYDNKRILLVSHSHAIKGLLSYIDSNKYCFSTKLLNMNMTHLSISKDKVEVKELHVF